MTQNLEKKAVNFIYASISKKKRAIEITKLIRLAYAAGLAAGKVPDNTPH